MNSRFHFSQKDNKNNLKEDESHYSTKDESVYNANINNNNQSYHTFSPWEKYSYYYQPKVTIPFYDNRTNIYNFINNDKNEHTHLFTKEWGKGDLSSEKQNLDENVELINLVTVRYFKDDE